jgi:hypothetical protein
MTKTVAFRLARLRDIALKALVAAALLAIASVAAQTGDRVMPAPQTEGGMPSMPGPKELRVTCSLAEQPLPPEVLSSLLWAPFAADRPDGLRTAPSVDYPRR